MKASKLTTRRIWAPALHPGIHAWILAHFHFSSIARVPFTPIRLNEEGSEEASQFVSVSRTIPNI